MELWYFERDPKHGFIYAGVKINGKRYVKMVLSQGEADFISTGARVTGDLQRHNFSAEQSAAFQDFLTSKQYSVEFKEAVL